MRITLAPTRSGQGIAVPADGPAQAFVESDARLPAEHALGLGRAKPLLIDLTRRRPRAAPPLALDAVEPLAIDLTRRRPRPEDLGLQVGTPGEPHDQPNEIEH